MKYLPIAMILLMACSGLQAQTKERTIFYKGTVVGIEESELSSNFWLKIKDKRNKFLTFTVGKRVKAPDGSWIRDEEFIKSVRALKKGQKIKVERVITNCDCICMTGFELLDSEETKE